MPEKKFESESLVFFGDAGVTEAIIFLALSLRIYKPGNYPCLRCSLQIGMLSLVSTIMFCLIKKLSKFVILFRRLPMIFPAHQALGKDENREAINPYKFFSNEQSPVRSI